MVFHVSLLLVFVGSGLSTFNKVLFDLTDSNSTELSWRNYYYAPAVGGGEIKRHRDPSVCLSQGAAVLGAQLP